MSYLTVISLLLLSNFATTKPSITIYVYPSLSKHNPPRVEYESASKKSVALVLEEVVKLRESALKSLVNTLIKDHHA